MNKEVIIRLRSDKGQNRFSFNVGFTLGEFKEKISSVLKEPITNFTIHLYKPNAMALSANNNTKLYQIPQIEDGIEVFIKFKQASQIQQQQKPQKMELEEQKSNIQNNQSTISSKCTHGPNGRCLNCITVEKKTEHSHIEKKAAIKKANCTHGANAKCIHCMETEFVGDVKHISFQEYLDQKKLKCKGVHPPTSYCINCLPPSKLNYKPKYNCNSGHEPYPKGQCSKCAPQPVALTKQPYRHVDYSQIMNIQEVTKFVNHWKKGDYQQQQVGFLYGYYAEDPNYKGGVRAIVECIYYPPQVGDISGFEILNDEFEYALYVVAESLTLERIGWVFTTINHDCFLTSNEIRLAAQFQEQYKVQHTNKYDLSTFVTVVLRTGKENAHEVQPEVYMVTDQAQVMERDGLFVDGERKKMKVDNKTGKEVQEFETDYLIVNIANGYSPDSKFSIIKNSNFPVENRDNIQPQELINYFQGNKSQSRFSDFHLLLHLAKIMDTETIVKICNLVAEEKNIPEETQQIIMQLLGF